MPLPTASAIALKIPVAARSYSITRRVSDCKPISHISLDSRYTSQATALSLPCHHACSPRASATPTPRTYIIGSKSRPMFGTRVPVAGMLWYPPQPYHRGTIATYLKKIASSSDATASVEIAGSGRAEPKTGTPTTPRKSSREYTTHSRPGQSIRADVGDDFAHQSRYHTDTVCRVVESSWTDFGILRSWSLDAVLGKSFHRKILSQHYKKAGLDGDGIPGTVFTSRSSAPIAELADIERRKIFEAPHDHNLTDK
ncbi:hypothetical protein CERZMDRAFT_84540 [Cercospora zeae-maydis SCOH1-5]|uniref:Uncharacterized protein n=1 Tax=Cercospora zeae-maydis SCOH1-5 TaxID=717836 RepID=A0A6A6FFF1_9PEZI|nr:hypothetical protein CERZMDRAFT_84540 [Cercospora zeae-maydis SCOH1-5]